MPVLRKEVLRLIVFTLLGAWLGWYWDKPGWGAAMVLCLLLVQHIWQLLRLARYLHIQSSVFLTNKAREAPSF